MFYAELIAVRLTYTSLFVRPLVPDMGIKVADIIALFLPNPKQFVYARFESRAADCENRKFFLQIIAVHYPE